MAYDLRLISRGTDMKNMILKKVSSKLNELKHNILDVLLVPFWNR